MNCMGRTVVKIPLDLRQSIKTLNDADKGRLFDAILAYGDQGIIPEFDGSLAVAWGFIRPKIDQDMEAYDRQIQQRQYASFSREIKKKGLHPVSFELLNDSCLFH